MGALFCGPWPAGGGGGGAAGAGRARPHFEALSRIAQLFSAPLDEVAAMVAAQLEAAKAGERARRKLELELAAYRGKELYTTTEAGAAGMRRSEEHTAE